MKSARRPAFFRVIRFDRTLRGSENTLAYVAFRSEDLKGKVPCVFDARQDHADVRAFMDRLEDRVTRHSTAAKAYHCLFSLRQEDFAQLGIPDWRDVVREVMRNYELQTHRKLDWIASHHPNPKRPHCHVVIKAAYTTDEGQHRKLFLNGQEVERIKGLLERSLSARGLTPDRYSHNRQAAHDRTVSAVGGVLSWLEAQIQAERRRRVREEDERLRRLLKEHEEERDGR